jgi:hypothetical protein
MTVNHRLVGPGLGGPMFCAVGIRVRRQAIDVLTWSGLM